jgi:hypothetical protein
MKNNEQTGRTRTDFPNLYRHRNQPYYARVFIGGKEIWKNMRASLKSVATGCMGEPPVGLNLFYERSNAFPPDYSCAVRQ